MNKVLAEINAMALINCLDTIQRLYGDTDDAIKKRYGGEREGLDIAMDYLGLSRQAYNICGQGPLPDGLLISQPDTNGNRHDKKFVFFEEYTSLATSTEGGNE